LLEERGFCVIVACLKGPDIIGDLLEEQGFPARALGANKRSVLRPISALVKLLKNERIDVVHSHLFAANVAARLAGAWSGVPVNISAIHGEDLWMKAWHRAVDRWTAIFTDCVTMCSQAVLEYEAAAIGIPREKSVVVLNGISLHEFEMDADATKKKHILGLPDDGFLVSTAGRLDEPTKGFRYFIDAAKQLVDRGKQVNFLIAGEGPSRAQLESQALSLGLKENVLFLGQRLDVNEIFAASDVVVVPSLSEGFGLTILEAWACRKPVVATHVGGIPEIVENGEDGLLVPSGDSRAISQAVERLLLDKVLAERLGNAGHGKVSRTFSIERMADQLAVLYRRLHARKSGGIDVHGH
jgi:glycosyltransferase involved in cell wall biosynthesis